MQLVAVFGYMRVFWGAKRVPEKLMVEMAATIELNAFLYLNDLSDIILCLSLERLFNEIVEVVNISPVVLAVMEVH